MNEQLDAAERAAIIDYEKPKLPLVLILGCARSGTTLLLQWLNQTGQFWIPSNFVARFYAAPLLGYRIQRLLTDPNLSFGSEMSGFVGEFTSDLGKTEGWLAPSEFWYFWRRFFPPIAAIEPQIEKASRFLSELAAIEADCQKPIAMKALIANQQICQLDEMFDRVVFVHLKRKTIFNAQSILEARIKHTGNIENWWSFKLPNQEHLETMNPFEQVVAQVLVTNRMLDEQLAAVDDDRKITINYEHFCGHPEDFHAELCSKLNVQSDALSLVVNTTPQRFRCANEIRLDDASWSALKEAEQHLQSGERIS